MGASEEETQEALARSLVATAIAHYAKVLTPDELEEVREYLLDELLCTSYGLARLRRLGACPDKKSSCLVNGAPPVGETYCNQWGGGVARRSTSGRSEAAVVWHDTRDTSSAYPPPAVGDAVTVTKMQGDIWGHSIRPGAPFDGPPTFPAPTTQSRLTPLGSGVPWLNTGLNGNTWWGDYEHGVTSFGGTSGKFFAAWADDRDGSSTTKLRGATFNE